MPDVEPCLHPDGYADHFIEAFSYCFPGQARLVDQSIADYGELLPHLFVADLVRFLEARFLDPSSQEENRKLISEIMSFISLQFTTGTEPVIELIAVSFVEHLPYPCEPAASMVDMLPANLAAELALQRA